MRAWVVAIACTGCFGQTERLEVEQSSLVASCGAVPEICEASELGSEACPVLLCLGWPENPFGTPEQYAQTVTCDGHRGVLHIATSQAVCEDEL